MAAGLVLAVVIAFVTSPLAPVGVVRSLAPNAGLHLAPGVTAIVVGAAALGVIVDRRDLDLAERGCRPVAGRVTPPRPLVDPDGSS